VPVRIVRPGADERDSRLERGEECGGGRRAAAVVRHLEHVDGAAGGQAVMEELRVDLLLHVTGQQHPSSPVADVQHDRDVVDAPPFIRRPKRHLTGTWPEDPDGDAVQAQRVTRREQHTACRRSSQGMTERPIPRPCPDHARIGHHRHAVAFQEQRQAGCVVLVRMRQDSEVQPSVPGRDAFVKESQESIGIGASIDQHARAAWALHEHGVALPHVQDRDPQATIRAATRQGAGQEQECHAGRRQDQRASTCGTTLRAPASIGPIDGPACPGG
jgi:hypothetical protein